MTKVQKWSKKEEVMSLSNKKIQKVSILGTSYFEFIFINKFKKT